MSMKKRKWLKTMFTGCVLGSLLITATCSGKKTSTEDDKTIKVGVLASITGPLESYGKQTVNGFELGLDYATGGTGKVDGKKIKFVVEDTETKADVAVKKSYEVIRRRES
ncbi:ABC transporter substrate-binding protein [Bacillus paranthracis]